MTTTIAPDVDTLEDLDWQPACQSDYCSTGHPAATHVCVYLLCKCLPLPICADCASTTRKNILLFTKPARWKCWIDGSVRFGILGEVIRIEPLS